MKNRHRNRWTVEDDNRLREMIAANSSITLMSAKLKRSAEAIRMRIVALGRPSKTPTTVVESGMLDPAPELPDDTPIGRIRFPTRILNILTNAGIQKVGEVREMSDDTLLSFQDCGGSSVAYLRETLGLPSTHGVQPLPPKAK